MDDSLFHEIEEDLQHERLMKLWQNYGMYIIGAIVAIVIATGTTIYWRKATYNKKVEQSQMFSQAGQLASQNRIEEALSILKQLHDRGGEYTKLAQLEQANLIIQHQQNKEDAIKIYDSLANDRKVDSKIRNLALLLSSLTQLDTSDPEALMQRLQQARTRANPWSAMMAEAQVILALRAGKPEQARAIFEDLKKDRSAPNTILQRMDAILSSHKPT